MNLRWQKSPKLRLEKKQSQKGRYVTFWIGGLQILVCSWMSQCWSSVRKRPKDRQQNSKETRNFPQYESSLYRVNTELLFSAYFWSVFTHTYIYIFFEIQVQCVLQEFGLVFGTRGGAVGWDTALQAGRSRVRWCHWNFSLTRNISWGYFRSARRTDNLVTLMCDLLEIWGS